MHEIPSHNQHVFRVKLVKKAIRPLKGVSKQPHRKFVHAKPMNADEREHFIVCVRVNNGIIAVWMLMVKPTLELLLSRFPVYIFCLLRACGEKSSNMLNYSRG